MNNGIDPNRKLDDLDLDNYSGDKLLDEDLTEEELYYLLEQERQEQERLTYERSRRAREETDEVNERLRKAKEEASKDYKSADSTKESSSDKKSDLDKDESKEKKDQKEKQAKEKEETKKESEQEKNTTTNNSKREESENKRQEVVGKNKEGNELTKPKTKFDKFNDQRKLASARLGKASNTINRAKALKHEVTHPLDTLGEAGAKVGKKAVSLVGKGVKALVSKIIAFLLALPPIGLLVLGFFVLLIIVAIIAIFIGYEYQQSQLNGVGYYDAPCQEITVIGTSSHPDSGTFSVEDYVAGVVQNEVGFWNDLTVDEVFAIAARTYVFKVAGETCTIENSTSYQTFTSNPGETARQAAMNTQGLVITDETGNLVLTQYDALAVKEVTSTNYILKQKDQHIPKSWIESHINSSTLSYYANHNHGNGISQWGARYLAEQGRSATDIIAYYLEGSTLKNTFLGAGLEGVPEYALTNNAGTILKGQRLDQFLLSKGSSIDALNALIVTNVNNAGRGTRAGVVAAAVTLIGEMNKYGVKLPYVFGGGHGAIQTGASPSWGVGSGLDCSGFISWAIYNGGVSIGANSSSNFASLGTVVELSDEAVLKPGDIIWRPATSNKVGHVAMVVGYDNTNHQYLTAEAVGSDYGIMFHKRSFNAKGCKGISMEEYYNSH